MSAADCHTATPLLRLAVDCGNTRVKAAVFADDVLQQRASFSYDALGDLVAWAAALPWTAALLSDTGAHGDDVAAQLRAAAPARPVTALTARCPLPITLGYDTPDTLGADRIACAAGAWHRWPGCNLLVADAGTALTLDVVLADGVMPGGNISAGLSMRLRALHEFTSRLPQVAAGEDDEVPLLGHDTPTALRAGAVLGMAHEIEGQAALLAGVLGRVKVLLTGGDAHLLAQHVRHPGVEVCPDLCLEGLNCILSLTTID